MDSILRTKDMLNVVGFARATLWRRVLHQHPLRVVGAPDPNPVPLGHPCGHQAAGHPIDLSSEPSSPTRLEPNIDFDLLVMTHFGP